MWRVVRRLLVVLMFGAATIAAFRAVQRLGPPAGPLADEADRGPAWPPIDRAPTAPVVAEGVHQTWCAPLDGRCPADFPVKASSSGIYHVPGGQFYERTVPARCYPTSAAAEVDGYRAAKR